MRASPIDRRAHDRLIVVGVPREFPAILAAVLHLPSAERSRVNSIVVDHGGVPREFTLPQVYEAMRHYGLRRRDIGVVWGEAFESRPLQWPVGVTLPPDRLPKETTP